MQLEDEGRLLTTREDALYDERERFVARLEFCKFRVGDILKVRYHGRAGGLGA